MLRRAVLAIFLSVVPAGAQLAQPDTASRWVDTILAPYAVARAPGCAVGVSRNGSLTFAKGYGVADLEHDVAITPETRFYIASLSKQFTAMSIVLLAQDRRLSLDDSVRKWVPEVPSFGRTITLRQLLNHTSGLRDYFTLLGVSGWPSDGQLTEQQFLSLVARQKTLNFVPGDEFLYSNTGYALLAIVVQRASGTSLREFAAERIFKPLGMTHTEFRDDHTTLIPQRALGYQPTGGTYHLNQPEFDVVGDGGAYSTVVDLAKWDANFSSGKVGGKSGIATMETPGRLNDGQPVPYALGIMIGRYRGLKTYSHGGAYGGYRSSLVRFPDRNISVITLCNTSNAPSELAEQVASVVLGLAAQPASVSTIDLSSGLASFGALSTPFDSTVVRRSSDLLEPIAGRYYSDELDLPVTIVARAGGLVFQRPNAAPIRFIAFTDDLFTNGEQMLLRVERDEHGGVTGFALTINRVRDLEFQRR